MYNPLKNTTMKKLILLCTVVLMMQSCNVTVEIPVPDDNSLTSEQRNNICWTSDTTSLTSSKSDVQAVTTEAIIITLMNPAPPPLTYVNRLLTHIFFIVFCFLLKFYSRFSHSLMVSLLNSGSSSRRIAPTRSKSSYTANGCTLAYRIVCLMFL